MGFFDEITKPFKNIGRELGKAGKGIGFDKWGPYAMMLAPFMFPGAGTGIMSKVFGKEFMKTAFMKSAAGTAIKEAAMKYAMASAMGRDNPELAAKSAFFTSLPFSYMKTGGDWDQMLGKDVITEIPGVPGGVSDRVSIKDYEDLITQPSSYRFPQADEYGRIRPLTGFAKTTPAYREYGQGMMDKWSGPRKGLQDFALTQPIDPSTTSWMPSYNMTTGYGDIPPIKPEWALPGGTDKLAEIEMQKDFMSQPSPYSPYAELTPTYEAFTDKLEGKIPPLPGEKVPGPLAGLDYMKREKKGPSLLDSFLRKEGDEVLGIGEKEWDPWYLGKTAYDLMQAKATEGDIAEEKRRRLDEFYEDLMRRPDPPSYFDDFFLGNKGGIASLAHGGRMGYYGGGIGPAGATLEETPMAARKAVTIKSQLEDLYKLYMEKGLLTPGMAKMFGWEDPNEYYNNELWQRDFGAPDTSFMNAPADETAMGPDAFGTLDYTDPDLYRGTGEGGGDDPIMDIPLGPAPTFADEFEGYTDLASGDPATDYRDMWEQYNDQIIRVGLPPISFEEFMELRGESGVEAGARGGRMGYYGGGELNAIPGGAISGPGTGTSDSIPAKLSNNEFVFTANAVKAAGGGDVNAGAQQLYGIMNALDPNSARINEPPVYS